MIRGTNCGRQIMDEHKHTEACGSTPETDSLLARLNNPSNKLTESQFRELRGKYFTVRHHRVKECGHLLDMINEPTFRNCEYCWWAFFSSHGELVNVTDEAFKEHGPTFVDRLRGKQYRKMFTRYMSTLAAFKLEADVMQAAKEAQEKNDEAGNIQSSGSTREADGQGQDNQDVPAAGQVSEQASAVNPDESTLV